MGPAPVVAQVVEAVREEEKVEVRHHGRNRAKDEGRSQAAGRSAAERVRIEPAKPWEIVSMRQRMITGGNEERDGGRREAGSGIT